MSNVITGTTTSETGDTRDARAIADSVRVRATHAQQQIWIAEQLAPDRSVYGMPMVIRLRGDVDAALIARCVTEIVRRHEVLRSRFVPDGDDLLLVTDAADPVEVPELDLRTYSGQWRDLLGQAAAEPFDLVTGPLIRVRLLRLSQTENVLFLNMHHIVADGWSLRLFWSELAQLYAAGVDGADTKLPELATRYCDFAMEQRHWVDSGGHQEALDLWVRELADAPTFLDLPTDRPRGETNVYQGTDLQLTAPGALCDAVLRCARSLRITPASMMAAAWGAVLARFTRHEDLLIGSPLAGRSRPEWESLIGLFVNTMPLRMRPSMAKPFADLAKEVQLSTLEALMRQDVPFTELVTAVGGSRSAGQAPLFQTAFSFEQSSQFETSLPGCEITELYELSNGAARFDLNLGVVEALGSLSLQFAYDSRLFDTGTIENLAKSYLALLGDASAHPGRQIGRLRTTAAGNEPFGIVSDESPHNENSGTLHGLFEKRVRMTPAAGALEREDGSQVSYAELNGQANRLARLLRSRGLATGDSVAIALAQDSSWPMAVLAVLKAGGAYVPVDPFAPVERISHILAESTPRFVLSRGDFAADVADGAVILRLDDEGIVSALAAEPGEDLDEIDVSDTQVAYIPFTSGSTGTPKGTLVTHANLVSFTSSAVTTFGLGPADRMLQNAAMTFDVHVEEFFPTWAAGGCLVYFDGDLSRTIADEYLEVLQSRTITICELPTSYWAELVNCDAFGSVGRLEHMRVLLVGGERAPTSAYQQWRDTGVPLINVYGLTETSVTSTTFQPSKDFGRDALLIGTPMPHAAVHVLDEALSAVGPGIPGEIYVAGPGVGLGYLNRPEMTSERFLPDPFSPRAGARMYRTGDYGRWTADGNLEFLGRSDRQVKIRGHRVEPAEIEAVVTGHPNVMQAVVTPERSRQGAGDVHLVAFIVGEGAEAAAVDRFLRARMPTYMVPARVVVVDRFPMTAHGKVDQEALLSIQPLPIERRERRGTEMELRLDGVYRTVLGLPDIDPDAEIFGLGFHSLTALRLVSRIQREFGVDVPIGDFFANSSIAAVAGLISAGNGATAEGRRPPTQDRT
ncbi:non-ribosomal peptide synthetase [Catenulispora pinisilvae]|uniref:non-ribosomal peptide synthetase n=1 Tax=Catenulispora pinisilvae TaxID=2705253 RepID=UPI0018924BB8|nr:non-ribosomal peptide synthetase [Catenulispora pinisilvae]